MPTFTGKGIEVYRLTVARTAVKMEAEGLRLRRGRLITPQMRRELGLRPRAPHAEVIAAIEARLAALVTEAHAEGGIQP